MTTHRQVKMVMLLVHRNWGKGYVALNILNVNIDKYEQRQCNQLAGTFPFQCGSVGRISPFTSLHTTGSLCVPADDRRERLDWVSETRERFYMRWASLRSDVFIPNDFIKTWLRWWANSYLGFLLLCEIIFDVESLPDLLGGFAFDHVGHCLAGDI